MFGWDWKNDPYFKPKKAKGDKIVSEPYVVEHKGCVELEVGGYARPINHPTPWKNDVAKDLMIERAEELANKYGYTTLKDVPLMENINDINNTKCPWDKYDIGSIWHDVKNGDDYIMVKCPERGRKWEKVSKTGGIDIDGGSGGVHI